MADVAISTQDSLQVGGTCAFPRCCGDRCDLCVPCDKSSSRASKWDWTHGPQLARLALLQEVLTRMQHNPSIAQERAPLSRVVTYVACSPSLA
jgi:hypothetical protein